MRARRRKVAKRAKEFKSEIIIEFFALSVLVESLRWHF